MKKEVKETGELLKVLLELFNDSSNKKVKGYLKNGCVYVNGVVITQYNYIVNKGDVIEINKNNKTHKKTPLDIIYEDDNFLVINKPSGLLSISTPKEKDKTAYHLVRDFIKGRGRNEKIFTLHRLDKDTSGVLVFVKSEKLKYQLQDDWDNLVITREYKAVVESGIKSINNYTCYLQEDKNYKVHVTKDEGKKAITTIEVVKENKKYALLKVTLKTGRKNQIRAVLEHLGYPILGDKKYNGAKYTRLCLHASKISFKNPLDKKVYTFSCDDKFSKTLI